MESARSLRLALVQEAVQHLSGSNVDGADVLVALLQVNLYDMKADEAQKTIQMVLKAFESGAVCCLHLLPGLVNSIADAESGGARGAPGSKGCRCCHCCPCSGQDLRCIVQELSSWTAVFPSWWMRSYGWDGSRRRLPDCSALRATLTTCIQPAQIPILKFMTEH